MARNPFICLPDATGKAPEFYVPLPPLYITIYFRFPSTEIPSSYTSSSTDYPPLFLLLPPANTLIIKITPTNLVQIKSDHRTVKSSQCQNVINL